MSAPLGRPVQPRRRPNRRLREPPWAPAEISVLACSLATHDEFPRAAARSPIHHRAVVLRPSERFFVSRADCSSSQTDMRPFDQGVVPTAGSQRHGKLGTSIWLHNPWTSVLRLRRDGFACSRPGTLSPA